jgi:hypothetical protein
MSGIPALEKCIREHANWAVRQEAVYALWRIAEVHKKPCPLVLVKAMLDDRELVRQSASIGASWFRSFEPQCVEVLLRCAESEHASVRSQALLSLARAAPKDKRVLAALEKGQKDERILVRHNTHVAIFHATDDLEQFLRYLVRLREDPEAMLAPRPKEKERRDRDEAHRWLSLIMATVLLGDWSEERPAELAEALMKCLDDKSHVMRRGACRMIARAVWLDNETAKSKYLGETPRPDVKEAPLKRSKTAVHLDKLKVRERLAELRDNDADASVRAAAREAIESLDKHPK